MGCADVEAPRRGLSRSKPKRLFHSFSERARANVWPKTGSGWRPEGGKLSARGKKVWRNGGPGFRRAERGPSWMPRTLPWQRRSQGASLAAPSRRSRRGYEIYDSHVSRSRSRRREEKEGWPMRVLWASVWKRRSSQLEGEAVGSAVVPGLQAHAGELVAELGDYEQAERSCDESACAPGRRTRGPITDTGHCTYHSPRVPVPGGRKAGQRCAQGRAKKVNADKKGDDHPNDHQQQERLASVYQSRGQYPKAEKLFEEVLERQTTNGSRSPPHHATRANLAAWTRKQGKYHMPRTAQEALEIETDKKTGRTITNYHHDQGLATSPGCKGPRGRIHRQRSCQGVLDGYSGQHWARAPPTPSDQGNLACCK